MAPPPANGPLDRLLAHPARIALIFSALHVLAWLLATAPFHTAPPLDMAEQLMWGPEWLLGTAKHPPLVPWLTEIFWKIGGYWGIALLATLPVAATFPPVLQIGLRLMPPQQALAGTVLIVGVYYFTWPTAEFNHNTLQLPIWPAIILLVHDVLARPAWWRWLLLGILAAAAVYTKYSTLVLILLSAIWILADVSGRRQLRTIWPWLAATLFLALIAPHVLWLVDADFLPLVYLSDGASGGRLAVVLFLGAQILDHLPMLVLLAAAGLLSTPALRSLPVLHEPDCRRHDLFLFYFAFLPVLATAGVAFVAGRGLISTWGAPMFSLSGLLAARLVARRLDRTRLTRLVAAAALLLVMFPAAWVARLQLELTVEGKLPLIRWPQAEIARRVELITKGETGGEYARVIAGGYWIASLAAMTARSSDPTGRRPKVLSIHGRQLSPWVSDADLAGTVVIVWDGTPLPPELESLWRRRGAPGFRDVAIPTGVAGVRYVNLRVAVLPPLGTSRFASR